MGLSVEVGILADLSENDAEGEAHDSESFDTLNECLRSVGVEPHREPRTRPIGSAGVFGY